MPLQPSSEEDADEFFQALNFPELVTNGIENATFDPDLPPMQFDLAPLIRKHRGELSESTQFIETKKAELRSFHAGELYADVPEENKP